MLRPRGSNHVGMRQFNERVVLQAIRLNGSLAKAELARLTGLTAQTIGLITARLEDDGLLIWHTPVRGRIGQPSVPMALNPDGAFSIGIKIGRRSADLLLVDFTGSVRSRKTLPYAFPDARTSCRRPSKFTCVNFTTSWKGSLPVWSAWVWRRRSIWAAGTKCSVYRKAFPTNGIASISVPRCKAFPMSRSALPKTRPLPGVAELVAGRGRDLKSFLYIFVDTFVGGGLVINSHLHNGIHGNGGAVALCPCRFRSRAGCRHS